jgi:hypothetical protein
MYVLATYHCGFFSGAMHLYIHISMHAHLVNIQMIASHGVLVDSTKWFAMVTAPWALHVALKACNVAHIVTKAYY